MIKTLMSLAVIFLAFGALQITNAQDDFDISTLSDFGQPAYKSLKQAPQFEDAYVGFNSSLSYYAKDLDTLINEPEARSAFLSLLKSGTDAGKLYALCGLYYVDIEAFNAEIEAFRKSKEMVEVASGCEIFSEPVANIVESKAPNVAIIGPGESLEQFLAGNKYVAYDIDILQGGYQATFRHHVKIAKERLKK